jgi:membrane dipeptidase
VPGFDSPEAAAWEAEEGRQRAAARQRFAADTAAAGKALDEWRAAHPKPRATIAQVADHVEHVRKVAGVDHVGIGSDFDGVSDLPIGLEDVSAYPALFAELARRGWSDADLKKLAGENVLRVLKQAESVAKRLQRERAPSTRTIEQLDGTRS